MASALAAVDDYSTDLVANGNAGNLLVTAYLDGQAIGLPAMAVNDVLGPQSITQIPLSPEQVAGALNLRGRIVTVIDLRSALGLPMYSGEAERMSIVVEFHGELYSMLVDSVGEVLNVPIAQRQDNPPTMDSRWRAVSSGVYRLDRGLMVSLDIDKVLGFTRSVDA